jgi:hypothetical protein
MPAAHECGQFFQEGRRLLADDGWLSVEVHPHWKSGDLTLTGDIDELGSSERIAMTSPSGWVARCLRSPRPTPGRGSELWYWPAATPSVKPKRWRLFPHSAQVQGANVRK